MRPPRPGRIPTINPTQTPRTRKRRWPTDMTCPSAEGLFHRAIAQSPPATSVYGAERAKTVAERFLELLSIDPEDAGDLLTTDLELVEKTQQEISSDTEDVIGDIYMGGGTPPSVLGAAAKLRERYPDVKFHEACRKYADRKSVV